MARSRSWHGVRGTKARQSRSEIGITQPDKLPVAHSVSSAHEKTRRPEAAGCCRVHALRSGRLIAARRATIPAGRDWVDRPGPHRPCATFGGWCRDLSWLTSSPVSAPHAMRAEIRRLGASARDGRAGAWPKARAEPGGSKGPARMPFGFVPRTTPQRHLR